jgi:Glucodextranase, domain N.
VLKTGAEALGSPGIDPRWARGDKDGIGTAYRSSSRVWFSIWNGILTEVYYPHVDKPQIRELIFSFTDGSTFFIDESSLNHRIERITEFSPSYRIISEDPNRRFRLIKEIITDNYAPSVIINVKIQHGENWNDSISSYFTIYPHIDGEGRTIMVTSCTGTLTGYSSLKETGHTWLLRQAASLLRPQLDM